MITLLPLINLEKDNYHLKKIFIANLTESNIEDDEYERAQKIWEHFGLKNLGQYHDLYLRTDVLLLTDVFENF